MSSLDGCIERVNQAICTMTGYIADELVGTPFSDLVHPDDRRAGETAVAALVQRSRAATCAQVVDAFLSGRREPSAALAGTLG